MPVIPIRPGWNGEIRFDARDKIELEARQLSSAYWTWLRGPRTGPEPLEPREIREQLQRLSERYDADR